MPLEEPEKLYHLYVNSEELGPRTVSQIEEAIAKGEVKLTDHCWTAETRQWQTLAEVFFYRAGRLSEKSEAPLSPLPPSPLQSPLAGQSINWIPALIVQTLFSSWIFFLEIRELLERPRALPKASQASLDAPATFVPLSLYILALVIYWSVFFHLHYRCWKALPKAYRATTPGKAVGLMFIPLFNLYWAFVSWPKLGEAVSRWQAVRDLPPQKYLKSIGIAYAILFPLSPLLRHYLPASFILLVPIDLFLFLLFYSGVTRSINVLLAPPNRVGGGVAPAVLPHHRTYGSVSGGS